MKRLILLFIALILAVPSCAHVPAAAHSGMGTVAGSTSLPVTHTVYEQGSRRVSTMQLSSSPVDSLVLGETVTLTADVRSGGVTPVGSVDFLANGVAIGSMPLMANGRRDGVASVSIDTLSRGTHTITAIYSGSPDVESSSDTATYLVR